MIKRCLLAKHGWEVDTRNARERKPQVLFIFKAARTATYQFMKYVLRPCTCVFCDTSKYTEGINRALRRMDARLMF